MSDITPSNAGAATVDACLRCLNEDPWERLRKIRDKAKKTKLQMLFRGQNILGYRHYADDVVKYFVQKSIANGIDILRIFDALNDPRNLKTAIEATIQEKGHVQACICYTVSPVHSIESFAKLAKQLEEMGANSICIKDMAGLLLPYTASELIQALKETVKIPIQLHSHYTAGTASMTYLKAIEAGVDVVDCAISPMALGTSQPATEPIVKTFQGTPYDCGLDMAKLNKVKDYFLPLRQKYLKSGLMDVKSLGVDVNTLLYQVPGGMLSNLISQLKQAGKDDKFYEVLAEVPRVREDAGYPPLVTPTSQIVGTQAVMNVLFGRYKTFPNESKGLLRGEYGKLPAPVNEEVRKMAIGDDKVITCRPADLLKPEMDKYREEIRDQATCEEDVLSYALFPEIAMKYFDWRDGIREEEEPAQKAAPAAAQEDESKPRELYVEDLSL